MSKLDDYTKEELESEVWVDVKKYEKHYRVSNLGRVKSLDRTVLRKGDEMSIKGVILKPAPNERQYLSVCLHKDGNRKTLKVHILVAMSFLDHTPLGVTGMVVNHINFRRQDNRVSNLEIVTMRDNCNQKHLKSTSKYTGVSKRKGAKSKEWASSITMCGKVVRIASFDSETDAAKSYQDVLNAFNNHGYDYALNLSKQISINQTNFNSQYKGVYIRRNKHSTKWVSAIKMGGKLKQIGLFSSEKEAHIAYQKAVINNK